MKILVVEDEIHSRQSLVKQIKTFDKAGKFEILEAANGKQGLDLFREEHPGLVFSDIKMPFISGLDLLKIIVSENPETKVIMISGYADFQYAQEAVNRGSIGYLLKPIDDAELSACLEKYLNQSLEKQRQDQETMILNEKDLLSKYMYSTISSEEPPQDFVHESIFNKLFIQYTIVNVLFKDDCYPAKSVFYKILKDTFSENGYTEFRMIVSSDTQWSIVFKASYNLSATLSKIERNLKQQGYHCFIGISAVHHRLQELKEAYRQSITAVKNKIFDQQNILYYSDIIKVRNENQYPEANQLNFFELYLIKTDFQHAYIVIESVFLALLNNSKLSIDSIENTLYKVTAIIKEVLAKTPQKNQEFLKPEVSFQLLDYDTREDLMEAIKQVIQVVCKYIEDNRQDKQVNIVNILIDYINQNYNNKLSLRDLAEKVFYLNHAYLSHLISEKTGKNYSSYLREVRINAAKELLKNPALSITEVATLSGYNDSSQFIQVFKKEAGITPKKFRDMLKHSQFQKNE